MSRDIVIQQTSVSDLQVIAKEAADSNLFGLTRSQAFTLGLLAQARSLNPVEAFIRYHVIEGRPSMKAEAMHAEFQRMGGTIEWVTSHAREATAIFKHPRHAPNGFEVSVTLDELVDSGVAMATDKQGKKYLKKMYKQFPAQMLRARCISQGVRAVDPGVILGCYTPEEISDFDPPPKVINVTPAAASQADAIGDELVQQLDAPTPTPREKAQRRQEERYPEPKGNPRDRHPAPADVAAALDQHDARTYREAISDIVQGADAEWAEAARRMDIEPDPKNPVVNAYQVENHITTWALEAGILKPEHVERDGKRDRKMMVDVLARIHRKNPDRFVGLVASYVAEKLAERKKAAEAVVYGESVPSQEPATPAEDVSQETAEEVHGEGDDAVVIERQSAPFEPAAV